MTRDALIRLSRLLALTCLLLPWAPAVRALDVTLDISQYGHTAWRIRDGFAKERVTSMAQTRDGYLWLGTRSALLRFDGLRAVAWEPPAGASLPEGDITKLLGARDGTLWIATVRGLASLKDGKLTRYPDVDFAVMSLLEDREGTLWIAGATIADESAVTAGRLCWRRGAAMECDRDAAIPGSAGVSLYEDHNGWIWVAGGDRLWRWAPAPRKLYQAPEGLKGIPQSIAEASDGTILLLTEGGVKQVVGDTLQPYALPGRPSTFKASNVFRDRDGGLWLGTLDAGVVHVHEGRSDLFTRADGLSGNGTWGGTFEDREGNVWVVTRDGLDLFHIQSAVPYSEAQNVPTPRAIVSGPDGSVWVATANGLLRLRARRVDEVIPLGQTSGASLLQDRRGRVWVGSPLGLAYVDNGSLIYVKDVAAGYIDSIAEDQEGDLWVAHRSAGLVRVSRDGKVEALPWASIGDGKWAWRVAHDAAQGGLWLGFFAGGIAHWVDGRVTRVYGAREGLAKGRVNQVTAAPDGTVWAATEGGLSRIKDGRVATLDSRGGLPCNWVLGTIVDSDGARWLSMTCGLVRIDRSDLERWTAAVDHGEPAPRLRPAVFDAYDGVGRFVRVDSFSPHLTRSSDGKLWFVMEDGLAEVDPRHLPFNKLPPPVHVEQVIADHKPYDVSTGVVRLPPLVRDVSIDYTALSFVAPEKVAFRYKLEGQDADWREVLNDREVQYSNLAPGRYRFRVTASNNSGVWNEQGATLDLEVAPAYWQTNWFRALCVLALLALGYAAYRLRLAQIAHQFTATLDARVAERTRIARDLHDTLLQSFHGLLLRFQTARALLPANPAQAAEVLDSAIDQTADAITEGRDAVKGLRTSATEMNDLADSLRAVGETLANENESNGVLRVEVQGTSRALHPIVRDEVFRIAAEALRNAFRHARAEVVEVEIRYDERQLRLRVRDDGKGIDPEVLRVEGREGHFGLRGMRERAKVVGGKLTVWSGPNTGTEVELSLPASRAYGAPRPRDPGGNEFADRD